MVHLRKWGLLVSAFCMLCLAFVWQLSASTGQAQETIPVPVGPTGDWNLVFNDEFDGTSLDTSKWVPCYWYAAGDGSQGCGDSGALSWYKRENDEVHDGSLHLVSKKETVTGTDGKTYNYTSGMVTSGRIGSAGQLKFSYLYGYAEVRAKVPATKGFWPSFWSLVQDGDYRLSTLPELDTSEIPTRDVTTTNMTYHGAVNSGTLAYQVASGTPNFSDDFHVFGSEWKPGEIIWYVDGIERARFTNSGIDSQYPMYMLLTMGVSSPTSWAGGPDDTTVFPSEYEFDYVRVWQRPGPPRDSIPPTVAITSPQNNTTIKPNSSLNITAAASDDVGVAKVEFYINNVLKATDTAAPYSYTWKVPGAKNTQYTLTVKAYDATGNVATNSVVVKSTQR